MKKIKIYTVNFGEQNFKAPSAFEFTSKIEDADVVLALGGDGTLLDAFRQMSVSKVNFDEVVLFGLNKGTVGFMANDLDFNETIYGALAESVDSLQEFKKAIVIPRIQDRDVIDVAVSSNGGYTYQEFKALNEVTLHPIDRHLFTTNMEIVVPSLGNCEGRLSYKGDGIIVATPTGSTAYNLSVNGPIVAPTASGIVISPIAPFSLASRPIVLSADASIQIEFETGACIDIDGREVAKGKNILIKIKMAPHYLHLYKRDNFFETIKTKLGWNHSIK